MNFKKPDISEIRSVEKLAQDDAFATLARSMRAIQEGKASSADIKRYLDAKAYIDPDRLAKTVEKERLANLSGKYKNVGEEEIAKISRLRDYLMSHPDLKYGNEFNPQQVKALLYDLKTQGKPRSIKYDEMYDDLMGMYEELGKRIEEAYGPVQSQTRVPASSPAEDAASLVTRHQEHQAERLHFYGVPSAQGFSNQSAQTFDSISKANEKLKHLY